MKIITRSLSRFTHYRNKKEGQVKCNESNKSSLMKIGAIKT